MTRTQNVPVHQPPVVKATEHTSRGHLEGGIIVVYGGPLGVQHDATTSVATAPIPADEPACEAVPMPEASLTSTNSRSEQLHSPAFTLSIRTNEARIAILEFWPPRQAQLRVCRPETTEISKVDCDCFRIELFTLAGHRTSSSATALDRCQQPEPHSEEMRSRLGGAYTIVLAVRARQFVAVEVVDVAQDRTREKTSRIAGGRCADTIPRSTVDL